MCHTMIIGAATVVIALLVVGAVACLSGEPPDNIHAAAAEIDLTHLPGGEKGNHGK